MARRFREPPLTNHTVKEHHLILWKWCLDEWWIFKDDCMVVNHKYSLDREPFICIPWFLSSVISLTLSHRGGSHAILPSKSVMNLMILFPAVKLNRWRRSWNRLWGGRLVLCKYPSQQHNSLQNKYHCLSREAHFFFLELTVCYLLQVKKKRPGRDGKMAGLVPVLYVSQSWWDWINSYQRLIWFSSNNRSDCPRAFII